MNILDRYMTHTVLVTIPHFGSAGTIIYLDFLALTRGEVLKDKAKPYPSTVQIRFTFTSEANAKRFTSQLTTTFQPKFCRHHYSKAPRFKDNIELLEHLVKTMDWTYEMSDDHRSWSSGQQQMDTIKFLIKELVPTHRPIVLRILCQAGKESLLPS